MARLIDADDLIRHAEETEITAIFPNYTELSSETRNAIGMYGQYWKTLLTDAPTIEAEPVKRGEWIEKYCSWYCSECGKSGYKGYIPAKPSDFCPNCGADMRGEKK